ncbi:cuticular protein, putative [Ixodes scapularis]|uniref:Cuticular protein, putative n=1 Tax=Ixodes scapularis TaxID=6945 RepID=B7PWU0_IXOSC|nr:cuticular protein, putative [Ixodes scapularis]|eukprot:XP_002410257.1 cuticular protein, putative [Ixodes scapularis]
MKTFLLLIALVLRGAQSGVVEAPTHGAVIVEESGTSTQHRNQDVHGNYDFGYEEKHTSGGSFRQESGDAYGRKYGSYGLTDADGRVRIVKYVADEHGFRATITTNEPGTAPSTPAGVAINVPQEPTVPVPVAPPPQKVIPVATTFEATPVGPPPVISAPAVSTPVVSTPLVSAPVGPAHFLSGPAGPAPVATYAAAPAVTTFKRFLPATGPAYSYSAAPVFQSGPAFSSVSAGPAFSSVSAGPAFSSVSTGPAFSSFATGPGFGRRVVVRTVPAAAFSSGFVPTLPYSGASKVVVRKAVFPSPGYYGGGELLKSASYTPTTVVAPAYGTKLSGPSFSYAAAASSVVPSAVATVDPWPKTGAIAAEPWGKSAVTAEDPWPKTGATAAEPWAKSAINAEDPLSKDVEYGPFGTRLGARYIRR